MKRKVLFFDMRAEEKLIKHRLPFLDIFSSFRVTSYQHSKSKMAFENGYPNRRNSSESFVKVLDFVKSSGCMSLGEL